MSDDHFEVVTVETGQIGQHLNITSARQAAHQLAAKWPVRPRGKAFDKAVTTCMDQLHGSRSAADVRRAFIAAAKEARIFVREGRLTE